MTHEEIDYLLERSKKYLGFGKILKVSVQQWPGKPFEPVDYYVDFYMYDTNLYASEKLSELSFEKFFDTIEVLHPYNIKSPYKNIRHMQPTNPNSCAKTVKIKSVLLSGKKPSFA
jgi:hypothetical protein